MFATVLKPVGGEGLVAVGFWAFSSRAELAAPPHNFTLLWWRKSSFASWSFKNRYITTYFQADLYAPSQVLSHEYDPFPIQFSRKCLKPKGIVWLHLHTATFISQALFFSCIIMKTFWQLLIEKWHEQRKRNYYERDKKVPFLLCNLWDSLHCGLLWHLHSFFF